MTVRTPHHSHLITQLATTSTSSERIRSWCRAVVAEL